MEKLPAWINTMLKPSPSQVSHGLNLVLKLRDPKLMPLMIWDILASRTKVRAMLDDLNFVHFARFVPSWDGRALMVITEFDGPLDPYVLDFAITIGDVFDRLLSYVDLPDPPPTPVRAHPDEFLAWVKRWNRVPFIGTDRDTDDLSPLFPESYDHSLYSAYPKLTVIDLLGKRDKLPPASPDRPGAALDLDDIQGNILRSYRAKRATHFFLKVTESAQARAWLSGGFLAKDSPWGGVRNAADWGSTRPAVMANVGFTFGGLEVLQPPSLTKQAELKTFPKAFRSGALGRAEGNGDIGTHAPGNWLFGQPNQSVHLMLSLYAFDDVDQFNTASSALDKALRANGFDIVTTHTAKQLPNGMEAFGFTDDLSEPRISGLCPMAGYDKQPACSPGEFILSDQAPSLFGAPSLGDMPSSLAKNGSFCAVRLLEQHVDVLDQWAQAQASNFVQTKDWVKARLMGRQTNGSPMPDLDATGNDFDYAPSWEHPNVQDDHQGVACPVGAHVRRTNPRNARVAGARHARRLIRRGMPSQWPDRYGKDHWGLFGMFFCASLEHQFEFIQRQWIQRSTGTGGFRLEHQDPIAGQRAQSTPFEILPGQWVDVPPLVTLKGSLYLFYPSLSALNPGAQRGEEKQTKSPVATPVGTAIKATLGVVNVVAGLLGSPIAQARALQAKLEKTQSDEFIRNWIQFGTSASVDTVIQVLRWIELPEPFRNRIIDLLEWRLDKDDFETFLKELDMLPYEAMNPGTVGPVRSIDPTDLRFLMDPATHYADLLMQVPGGVVWVPEHQAYWVLGREEVQRVLGDSAGFRQKPRVVKFRGIITSDGVDHARVRGAVIGAINASFGPGFSGTSESIDTAVKLALSGLGQRQQFDVVRDFGQVVPKAVFWTFFGLPESLQSEFDDLAHTIMRHFGQPDGPGKGHRIARADAGLKLLRHMTLLLSAALVASCAGGVNPYAKTLIGEIAARTKLAPFAADPTRVIEFGEALSTLVQFTTAGYMSMEFLISTATLNLLKPDPRTGPSPQLPWRQLHEIWLDSGKDDKVLIKALEVALEEVRRFDPPVTIIQRYAAQGATLDGAQHPLPQDCPVFLMVASANRDGAPELMQFHWDRAPGAGHVSLGTGVHECVGKLLQEKLVPQALAALIKKYPDLRLSSPTATPAWLDNVYFRALTSLPVQACA